MGNMKIVQLPDVLHEYLIQLIEAHAARGIHPEEGLAVNRLWNAVKNLATHIDDAAMAQMAAAGAAPEVVPAEAQSDAQQGKQTGPIEGV